MVEAGEFGGPPNGYHPLPEGHRCRCQKLWTDGKGNHWCCRPIPTASPAPALPESGVDDARKAVERLANVKMNLSLEEWNDLSNTILAALATSAPAPAPAPAHPDDAAVDRFAAAMKAKLAKKRAEGRGGWEDKDDCSNAFLSKLLREHIDKGDPVDVGNLAMMIHQRGERIS